MSRRETFKASRVIYLGHLSIGTSKSRRECNNYFFANTYFVSFLFVKRIHMTEWELQYVVAEAKYLRFLRRARNCDVAVYRRYSVINVMTYTCQTMTGFPTLDRKSIKLRCVGDLNLTFC